MTTELEALRRVAEAARKWRFIGDHTSQWEATERVEALEQAIDELDALPAMPLASRAAISAARQAWERGE